jgi:tetratricopeptide (TPR) repeat protein
MQKRLWFGLCALLVTLAPAAPGQSSSSSPGSAERNQSLPSTSAPTRAPRPEAGGAAITLETSEPLFDIAVALNACGYDGDLANSDPIRLKIRQEVDDLVAGSPAAQASRKDLCLYIADHQLADKSREIAQYVSLGLFLSPPPDLETTADQSDMPPDALQVVNMLPQLRAFARDIGIIGLWQRHRAEYTAIADKVHDPVTRMILGTNFYLRVPASTYDGRRFEVLVEPMLPPSAPNARIYETNYIVVTSPDKAGFVKMDDIRHTYLHYVIEPLVYSRSNAMERLLPLLKPVQRAPLDFNYKNDVIALVSECLIKAVEARTMYVGEDRPELPPGPRERIDPVFDAKLAAYERRAEAVRQRQIDLDMRQGWVLSAYFYSKLAAMEHDTVGLKEDIGEMVYGMDVDRERHNAEQIAFLPETSSEFVRRGPRILTGLALGEKKMMDGDIDGALEVAQKALDDPHQDHAEATYLLARIQLIQRQPQESVSSFEQVVKASKNPHTIAWAHVYLGRLYDTEPDRPKALTEYRAAIATLEGQPVAQDARVAAEHGLKTPFVLPRLAPPPAPDEPFDPTGKAEKEQYEKDNPQPPSVPAPPPVKPHP